jgi:RHS repeat-associated protein
MMRSFGYDKVGNRITVTDALGNTTRYIRSKAGDILTTIDPLGHETHFAYDKCHRLIGIDRGEGRVTKYTRDKAGNVITVTDALDNAEKYEYDCHGRIVTKTDMDGNTTSIKRNICGDISLIKYADSTEVEYSYDALRRLKEVKDSLGVMSIERDALGRETKIKDHKGRSVSYIYDKYGNLSGITYPGGKHVAYERDIMGRTTRILSDDIEASISYDGFGRKTERRCGSQITSYAYDKLGRLSELTHRKNNELIHSEILSCDAEDNILSDGSNTFEYDGLNRLTSVKDGSRAIREYTYDAYGNRTSLTENGNTVTYLYNEADQLVSSSDGYGYRYDKRGNVIEKSLNGEIQNIYIYGANNRLKQAINVNDDIAFYKYNGLGNRVGKKVNGEDIDYLLDQTKMYNNLLEANGESFVWDENHLLFRNREAEARDRLGSPFGVNEFGSMTEAGELGFTGYMYDDVSGTYFAQAREYIPEIGRFAGRDILKGNVEDTGRLNDYLYCHNNPIGFVDFNGMEERDYSDLPDEALKYGRNQGVGLGYQFGEAKIKYDIKSWRIDRQYNAGKELLQKEISETRRVTGNPRAGSGRLGNLTKNKNAQMRAIEKERDISMLKVKDLSANNIGRSAIKGGITGGVVDAGLGAVDDYYSGASRSKMLTNMGVNFAFGAVEGAVIGAAFAVAPPLGILAIVGVFAYEYTFGHREMVKDDINSLD